MRRSLVSMLLIATIGGACASRERPTPTPTAFPTPAPETPATLPAPPPRETTPRPRVRTITLQTDEGRIVTIDLDTYVQGTVAAEAWVRSTENSAVAERIFEVQALVARTYALANVGRHAADGFDLCSRTHCQVYRSPTREAIWAESIATAVTRTSGSMIAFNGVPILALFHANCGGGTSAAEDIWGGTSRPYLVAVEDKECDTPSAHWAITLSRSALVRVFDADAKTRVDGRLDSIDVLEADRTGRVMLAALTGARSPVVRGEELRGILGRAFGVRSIRSPRFVVHRQGEAFVFEGSGSGHGAGLCQFGAMRRLRAGATAQQVIEYYYPGARVVRLARDET